MQANWIQERTAAARTIRDLIIPHAQVRSAALFGSFARGEAFSESSDIDLLLLGDLIHKRPYERAVWFAPVSAAWKNHQSTQYKKLPSSLSPLFSTEKGWLDSIGLRLSLCSHAWILYDDGFLSQSLHEAQVWIQKGEWTRHDFSRGGFAWIPKAKAAA